MFKKIYIEITNECNLNCSFCSKNKREKRTLNLSEFEHIIKSINNYTNYIYLHVLGEPLLHNDLDGILKLAGKYNKKVNITTNGTMLKGRKDILINNKEIIRQINISIHSYPNINNYFDNIYDSIEDILSDSNIIISLRLWNIGSNIDNEKFYNFLTSKYNINDNDIRNNMSIKIKNNLYLNHDYLFNWPSLDNECYSRQGSCYGTITQLGILSDGTVVPCCLDSAGIINLGNIFETNFDSIIASDRFKKIKNGFKNSSKCEELCQHCDFLNKKNLLTK